MSFPLKVTEISENKIVFDNGLSAERDPKLGKDAPIQAERDLIYLVAEGFFKAKKRHFHLLLEWRTWCYRDMVRYNKNAGDDDFSYFLGFS